MNGQFGKSARFRDADFAGTAREKVIGNPIINCVTVRSTKVEMSIATARRGITMSSPTSQDDPATEADSCPRPQTSPRFRRQLKR
jgi:hypothetical protein